MRASLIASFAGFLVCQSAYADLLFMNNDFNDYSSMTNSANPPIGLPSGINGSYTNVFSNTNGIGGGFYVCNWSSGQITESNSFINLKGYVNGGDRSAIASVSAMPISSSGSVFEFTNVMFSMNPITGPNGIDRVYVGIASTNDFFTGANNGDPNDGWQTAPPAGFYVEFEGDSCAGGSGNFDGQSVFFYRTASGTVIPIATWTFDTLNFRYSADGGDTNLFNFTPSLDIKITIDGSNWHLQITGDTAGGAPIDYSGTYAGNFAGAIPNEISKGYAVVYNQSSVNMSIDQVIMKQKGDFVVGTPQISTPDYPYNTNYVYAGERVVLSDTATGAGTLSYQWQMQDPAGSGSYTDILDATNLTTTLDTTTLGDANERNIRLLVSNNLGASTNSAPVILTVAPATAPIVSQDTTLSPSATNYAGGQVTLTASFVGNHPIAYLWQDSADGSSWQNIAGATNTSFLVTNLQVATAPFYRLTATNAIGGGVSSAAQLTVLAGGQKYVWSSPVDFLGLSAAQILMGPAGNVAGAAMFGNGPITVSLGSAQPNFVFSSDGSIATVTGAGNGFTGAFGTNTTGNTSFDSVLGGFNPDGVGGPTKTITISNLVVGRQYSIQLFALDDRSGISSPRSVDFQDPNDPADVSIPFDTTTANSYLVGTFYASNATETIQENLLDGPGNLNALVVRAIGWNPPPYIALVANQTTYGGMSVNFKGIVGSYTTALDYQWMAGPAGGPYTNLVNGTKYSGVNTATLTINNVSTDDGSLEYLITASNPDVSGTVTSAPASLTVNTLTVTPTLLGEWLTGSQSFADMSGYTNAHDGYIVGENYVWTNDVPPGKSGYSLHFGANNGDTLVVITNTSSTLDTAGYTATFDSTVQNNLTVACWAKGFPSSWNPWVSKGGESGIGYQLRRHGGDPTSCWTIRGTSGANGGDLQASTGSNDGKWHFYVGTYDGSVQTLYVDGVQVAQQAASGPISPDDGAPLVIGAKSQDGGGITSGSIAGGSYLSDASIYDVRIYNYALTAGQVEALAAVPVTPTLKLAASGSNLTLSWTGGVLLEATNIAGPWTTNVNTSPVTVVPSGPQKFFRVLQQ